MLVCKHEKGYSHCRHLTLIVGVGGVWLKTRLNAQAVTEVVQEQPKSKYDVGPPDAQ